MWLVESILAIKVQLPGMTVDSIYSHRTPKLRSQSVPMFFPRNATTRLWKFVLCLSAPVTGYFPAPSLCSGVIVCSNRLPESQTFGVVSRFSSPVKRYYKPCKRREEDCKNSLLVRHYLEQELSVNCSWYGVDRRPPVYYDGNRVGGGEKGTTLGVSSEGEIGQIRG